MDLKLAERITKYLVPIIIKDLKQEEIDLFQMKIKQDWELNKLKSIASKIESQILKIADGILPDQLEIDSQAEEGESWWSRWLKMKGLDGN
jgi:hypothetical protein